VSEEQLACRVDFSKTLNQSAKCVSHSSIVRIIRTRVFANPMVIRIKWCRNLSWVAENRGVFLQDHLAGRRLLAPGCIGNVLARIITYNTKKPANDRGRLSLVE
jgi:hypothetical protein